MCEYAVAHIRQQNVVLAIVPLEDAFHYRTPAQQNQTMRALQSAWTSTGRMGTVVPVWNTPDGRMGFIARHNWRPFFKSINMGVVRQNLNYKLTSNW